MLFTLIRQRLSKPQDLLAHKKPARKSKPGKKKDLSGRGGVTRLKVTWSDTDGVQLTPEQQQSEQLEPPVKRALSAAQRSDPTGLLAEQRGVSPSFNEGSGQGGGVSPSFLEGSGQEGASIGAHRIMSAGRAELEGELLGEGTVTEPEGSLLDDDVEALAKGILAEAGDSETSASRLPGGEPGLRETHEFGAEAGPGFEPGTIMLEGAAGGDPHRVKDDGSNTASSSYNHGLRRLTTVSKGGGWRSCWGNIGGSDLYISLVVFEPL